MTSTPQNGSEIVSILEKTWHAIVERHPELPDVVIITGSGLDGMGGRWGHFWKERWQNKGADGTRPELFIAGERLACGATLTLQTMLHEAVHALAYVRDVKDCSRQNRYHNGQFLKIAEELGLEYRADAPDKVIGYSSVDLTDTTKSAYEVVIKELDDMIRTFVKGPSWMMPTTGTDGTTVTVNGDDGAHRIRGIKGTKTTTTDRNNGKATCECVPARILRVSRKTFDMGDIVCGVCGTAFAIN